MISSVKQAIVNKLLEFYPAADGYTIYDEDVPQNFKQKSFLITLTDQEYSKRLNAKNKGLLSFDVAYFSDKGKEVIKADCLAVQESLLREIDLISTYRVQSKQAQITDNVLHVTFDIRYSELKEEVSVAMQTQTTNTNM